MRGISRIFLAAGVILAVFTLMAAAQVLTSGSATASARGLQQTEPTDEPWMDHSLFPQLAGPFETGPDVTAACITCHLVSAEEVMATTHWTWQYEDPETGEQLGKYNVVNNYCINPQSNEPRCTSCHVGYGWTDNTFDFTAPENVDCLVCHDRTGSYQKYPTGAGHPAYEDTEWKGNPWPAVDLVNVAQQVGPPTRENCGSCHFYGGGGDAVKHGDLDTTLTEPDFSLDVHMSPEGADFQCQDCHTTEQHEITGSYYTVAGERLNCADCHSEEPHADAILNMHAGTISCQTCHIPEYARGRTTKMTWDWSTAGQLDAEGKPFTEKDENGDIIYDSQKGSFTWEKDVIPAYFWWNGIVDYQTVGEAIDPSQVVQINALMGSREDENARIYPFKLFTGSQPYDTGNNVLAIPALYPGAAGGADAYWKAYDWGLAIQAGMAYAGLEFSGEYDFIETEMYWLITHQVAPAEEALGCMDCHSGEGRLDFAALGYGEEEVVALASFPPGAQAQPTEAPAEVEETELPAPTEMPTPQPTFEPLPTYAPPENTLGEVELEVRAGLTPLAWILIVLGAIAIIIVALVVFFRIRKRTKSS